MRCGNHDKMLNVNLTLEEQVLYKRNYREVLMVGQGAFANVYRAWDEQKRRVVACKVSTQGKLLQRESEVLKRIRHPLFAGYYDYFEEGEWAVLVMEYVAGATLAELLQRRGSMSEAQAFRIGRELAEGLRFLHESHPPVIFRDLKPENIIIREDGSIKLIDLGCVADVGERTIAGSKGYAAPEQMLGNMPCGPYTDVYGWGKTLQQVRKKHRREWRELLEQCVRFEIEERIPDMRYVLYSLSILDGQNHKMRRFMKFLKNISTRDLDNYCYLKNICLF